MPQEATIDAVYAELRAIAQVYFSTERPGAVLQPTALVHEAFLRLSEADCGGFQDRSHFIAAAATVMRHILVDEARGQRRAKRGRGWTRVGLDGVAAEGQEAWDLLALDEALRELARLDPRQAELVELRFFGGMSLKEVAERLGVSERTASYDWAMARRFLRLHLDHSG